MQESNRKIIVTEFFTLDGKFTQEDQWVVQDFGADMGAYEDETYAAADTLLLGAGAYKAMAPYWSTVKTNPDAYEGDTEFADTMTNIKKIVFSKTPLEPEWGETTFLGEINADEIKKLKQMPGKNMLIVGSSSIVQQFTDLGLIDEYHLLVHPVILASGKSLFDGVNRRQNLKLIEAKPFENGVVLLRYQAVHD